MESPGIEALRRAYESDLLGSNFRLVIESWRPDSGLGALAESDELLRLELVARSRGLSWPGAMLEAIGRAWCERFSSGLVAAHAMALQLFRIEEDNWFSFDRALRASLWFAEPLRHAERRELVLLKGVNPGLAFPGLFFAPDLPVVLDLGEGLLSLILVGLAD
jgi:hypothetical protein